MRAPLRGQDHQDFHHALLSLIVKSDPRCCTSRLKTLEDAGSAIGLRDLIQISQIAADGKDSSLKTSLSNRGAFVFSALDFW
jgi:hypothetical protein